MEKDESDVLLDLVRQLLNLQPKLQDESKNSKPPRAPKPAFPQQPPNIQVQELDISDYLQLLAHQKKHISHSRWEKLNNINRSGMLEQMDFKYFFAVASQAHFRRLEHPGYFKLLVNFKENYPNGFFNPIEKDVPRTLSPGHPFLEPLKQILTAYAIRNPSLVYCQGMNYLVAYFLINEVSPEQTFWILACLVENWLPDDYFKDLTTISIVTCIVEDVLSEAVPEFQEILVEAGMDASVILVPWLVCLFSKGFTTSVSAYLISYFMLQAQRERAGFVLLKICVGIFNVVLQRQNRLPFSKDFKTLKDALELYVFGISLQEIRESLDELNLNYSAYLKLQDYYRQQKKQTRALLLRNRTKKMALPPCSKDYPVCFHRIQIEKKLGAVQNAMILKNGFSIQQQMVENYLEMDQQEETADISYTTFEQCEIGRQEHVCNLNEQESHSKIDPRGQKFQREMTNKIEIIEENSSSLDQSVQRELQLSTYEERFREVTDYFVVDYQFEDEDQDLEDRECEAELQKQFDQFSREKELPIPCDSIKPETSQANQEEEEDKKGLRAYLGKALKKATNLISQFQRAKETRRSRTIIESPPHFDHLMKPQGSGLRFD